MVFRAWIGAPWILAFALSCLLPVVRPLDAEDGTFPTFVRAQAEQLRAGDRAPSSRADWETRREKLREQLRQAWGVFPPQPCPLEPQKLGELKREGYRVEKIIFQTMPGVWMAANAYVPERPGPLPAVLCVHGHWQFAKQDPKVQARCIGLAKLGFFVLAVDAFGAGERGVQEQLGEYHGEMTGAMLLPIGRPLSGIQVYENMRAVDYLRSRPEIDPQRIGVTGASGGGNQSMYVGTFDERIAATVPVCSVGSYEAYLAAACCMCEVVPGAIRHTEEGDLLGLAAPRALMVISATADAPQFSVREASKSFARASDIFELYEVGSRARHTIIESGHDYNQAMREAMYGWMTKFLKGEGDGSPIAEPPHTTETPETLRCFPGDSRPDDYITIPRFAAREARAMLGARRRPATDKDWKQETAASKSQLAKTLAVPASLPAEFDLDVQMLDGGIQELRYSVEPHIVLTAHVQPPVTSTEHLVLLLDCDGENTAAGQPLAAECRAAGASVLTVDLRATGKHAVKGDVIGNAPDHNSAEWSLWIGRPLLGQWVVDVRRTLDAVARVRNGKLPCQVDLVGRGPAGLVALAAGTLDDRIHRVAMDGTLVSYVSEHPYRGQRLALMVPGILREVGDVPHWAACLAPRPLIVAGGVRGNGERVPDDQVPQFFEYTRNRYQAFGHSERLRFVPATGLGPLLASPSTDMP